jgi:hypothetical protein
LSLHLDSSSEPYAATRLPTQLFCRLAVACPPPSSRPAAACAAAQVICHGIPDARELQEGDIVNVDVSVFLNGFHGDLNETFVVRVQGVGARVRVCACSGGGGAHSGCVCRGSGDPGGAGLLAALPPGRPSPSQARTHRWARWTPSPGT